MRYDPESGVFTRLATTSPNAKAGQQAGTFRKDGRQQISIDGRHYLSSRLAWFYVYGQWPTPDVDHINRIRCDDRLTNLREATRAQNVANRGKQLGGYSKYMGVSRKRSRWEARIACEGKQIRLGIYATEEEAARTYDDAAQRIHGRFAVLNFAT
jgi:hypothetical protein